MKEQEKMTEKLYLAFYESVKKSYVAYLIYGDRSDKKLKPLHEFIGTTIQRLIPKNYKVYFINGKEVKTEGGYYPKIVDIAIVKENVRIKIERGGFKQVYYIPHIDMAISIKFITSNFRQNANNYFENLLGECANIKSAGTKFGHFVVFRDKIPYFKRDKSIGHWEILENKDLRKYIKLFEEREKHLHTPDVIGMEIVHINPIIEEIKNRKPPFQNLDERHIEISDGLQYLNINQDIKKWILNNFNLIHFFNEIQKIIENLNEV